MDQSADFTKFAKTKVDDCCTNDLKAWVWVEQLDPVIIIPGANLSKIHNPRKGFSRPILSCT
jgi:hypothetical protein